MKQQQEQAYSGRLTEGAKKRMRRAIELLCMSAKPQVILNTVTHRYIKHRLSFITLTISKHENVTARQSYDEVFCHFMQWLRRTKKVNTYVWKVEVQKRGQIHYHITTPNFIHYQDIKDKWNNLQSKAGYLTQWFNDHGNKMPNSTDIHEVRHVNDLSSYMLKEFCKAVQNPNTDGKIWDCSINLKKHKYFSVNMEAWHEQAIKQLEEQGKIYIDHFDRYSIIKLQNASNSEILTIRDIHQLDTYLKQVIGKQEKK